MSSRRRVESLLCLVIIWSVFSGFLSSTSDYRISIPEESEKYEVSYWGIMRIEDERFQAFIRPANEIQTGYGTVFLFVIPTNKKIKDGKYYFTDSRYYYDAVVEHRQPEKFVVELYLNPKSESLSFNPAACTLSIDGKVVKVARYYIVTGDVSLYPIVRDKLPRPRPRERVLFKNEELMKALESPFLDNVAHPIKRGLGFVVEFDYPTPVPGKDVFTFVLNGLISNGNANPPITLNYKQSRELLRVYHTL